MLALVSFHAVNARADEAPPPSVSEQHTESYALPLGLAYVLAPGLALAAGGGLSALEVDDGYAVLGGAIMFTLPAAVHAYHDRTEQAGLSLLGTLGMTAGGALAGGILGWVIAGRNCEGNSDSDACNSRFDVAPVTAAIGGAVGYVGHAIWDVAARSDKPSARETPTEPLVWIQPNVSRAEHGGQRKTRLDGFQAGVSLSF